LYWKKNHTKKNSIYFLIIFVFLLLMLLFINIIHIPTRDWIKWREKKKNRVFYSTRVTADNTNASLLWSLQFNFTVPYEFITSIWKWSDVWQMYSGFPIFRYYSCSRSWHISIRVIVEGLPRFIWFIFIDGFVFSLNIH